MHPQEVVTRTFALNIFAYKAYLQLEKPVNNPQPCNRKKVDKKNLYLLNGTC